MMDSTSIRPETSGLSHLVEVATALTALVKSPKASPHNEQPPKQAPIVSDDECRKTSETKTQKKKEIFPQKLMDILSDSSLSDVVSWLPHGRSFVIIRPDMFTEHVLPKYMPPVDARSSTKYPSFTRKLNRWGFRQATRGPDTGAFHHPLFRRDQPELCAQMVCQKSRERQPVRRGLPLKKRSGRPLVPNVVSDSSHATTVSADDGSTCSNENSASSSADSEPPQRCHPPLSIISGIMKDYSGPLPIISNDSEFVASTLLERDRTEVLKAAKAMLYEAYLNAKKQAES